MKMTPNEIKRISKSISKTLRHKPERVGITLDSQGWASVRQLLEALADMDPAAAVWGENAMKKMGPIDHPNWRFRFAGEDFFLTTLSRVYPKSSSRYAFDANSDFVLFQPMTSFGRHGLKTDTPASATQWEKPKTMRDKARVAFRNNGCPYHIPEQLPYPVAEHVVKPLEDNGTNVVKWWIPLVEEEEEKSNRNNLFHPDLFSLF